MKKGFEEIKICNICKSSKSIHFITSPDRNYQTGQFNYIQCQSCQLVWLSPRPTKKIISRYYPDRYRAYQNLPNLNNLQKIVRFLIKRTFISKLFIKDNLFFNKKKGRILDVGTGNGFYLDILKEWGYEVYGVEINPKAVKQILKRGLNVKQGDLFSARYPSKFFDTVRFSHVIEHLPSPKRALIETSRILKENGSIIINIPNINSLFFKIFKSYWYPLEPPRHLYHFNEKNIRKILKETGFKNIDIEYYQSPYNFLRSLLYFLGQKKVEKRIGIFSFPLYLVFKTLNILKLSDTFIITAINNEK